MAILQDTIHSKLQNARTTWCVAYRSLPRATNYPLRAIAGFTLVELLLAMTLISILSGIGITSYSSAQQKSRDAQRKADIKEIAAALQQYYTDNDRYPITAAGTWNTSAGVAPTYWITDNGTNPSGSRRPLNQNYLSRVPVDPRRDTTGAVCDPETTATCFVYRYRSTDPGGASTCQINTPGQGYILEARMENLRDNDKSVIQAAICANGGTYGPFGTPPRVYVRTEM